MRAALRTRYGIPDDIRVEDVAKPVPGAGELLVNVRAATVSRTDCALLTASPFVMRFMTGLWRPKRAILGTDFAGRVEAVGSGVTDFRVGDDVWGINDLGSGSHAEYLTISVDDAVGPMPAGVDFADAAACIEGAWYAHSILERSAFENGKRVLINGATGAIGSALLQLAVHRGARVTAVGNTKNSSLLATLGAERVIDYEQSDFTQDDGDYDYVFDAVGKSTFGACKHLLVPKGVYASTELGPGAQNLFLPLVTPLLGGPHVAFPFPVEKKRFLEGMRSLVAEGSFRAVIDRAFSLDQIREAYTYAASGQKTGSVILDLVPPEPKRCS